MTAWAPKGALFGLLHGGLGGGARSIYPPAFRLAGCLTHSSMANKPTKKGLCPSCGFKNDGQSSLSRCVSCGAPLQAPSEEPEIEGEGRYQQQGFSVLWFLIATVVMGALTASVVIGLPKVAPVFDFEGYAGMMMSIPIWAVGGALVGLISPGRTFVEPVVAAFLVAVPTAFLLFQGQTVKTMPLFMYVLFSALGILFTLVGAYAGERIQLGPEAHAE